jgi:hypothetical protein
MLVVPVFFFLLGIKFWVILLTQKYGKILEILDLIVV